HSTFRFRQPKPLLRRPIEGVKLALDVKPLKLYTKTTLLISAVVVAVFATAFYLYDSATISMAREQQRRRAELQVTLLAELIEIEQTTSNIASLRNTVIQFKRTRRDVSEIHIYIFINKELHEVIGYPDSFRPLPAGILKALQKQPAYS